MNTTHSQPRARKPHVCEVCGPTIKPGDIYVRTVSFDAGQVFVWKCCLPCADAVEQACDQHYCDDDWGVTGENVREWARDHLGLYDAAAGVINRINQHNTPSEGAR